MTEVPVNQKEYIKKYLGIGKAPGEKKKKKKKPATTVNRVQIIDDDADANIPFVNVDDDPLNEDAPQIVAIIDERPPSLRVDDKTKNPLWQPIGTVENVGSNEQKQMISSFKIAPKVNEKVLKTDKSVLKRKHNSSNHSSRSQVSPLRDVVIKEERKSVSPPRKSRKENDDYSPLREIKQEVESPPRSLEENTHYEDSKKDDDVSPPRKSRKKDISFSRRSRKEDDISPPRRTRTDDDISPPRKSRKDDISPPRRNRKEDDSSPPRRTRKDDDISPPRRSRRGDVDNSPPRKSRKENDSSPHGRNRRDVDISPSRINRKDISPQRRSRKENDISPPRKSRKTDDISPPRRTQARKEGNSPPRRNRKDNSPKRSSRNEDNDRDDKRPIRMEKTLDGKSAGLQNARELIEETRNFKKREDSLFKNLATEVSGQNAETVHRNRKTGKIRNVEEEEERQRKKREEDEKNKEKYERWGRGLAQVESREQKLQDQLHEMSKPLARYADDEDLERYLKEQEREGDPMLDYIRKKKRKKMAVAGIELKPQFEGEFMPNRYGIRPGHRWDGVDRSNGYETKWFEIQNQKTAVLEDSYKWSTEDM